MIGTNRMALSGMLLGTLLLAGCGVKMPHINSTPPAPATPGTLAGSVDEAFDVLMKGDEGGARRRLKAILKREPMNAQAQLLSESISRDPKELLGPQSYPYSVKAGDTIVELARRFLGNKLKAYQLLRYNELKAPVTLTAGQTLRIPGEPPRIEPVKRPEPAPSATSVANPKPKPAATPKPTTPAANPALARQARAAGLAALNQGNVARAIALLHRATALDPGNPLIARDLARAERIAATVKARR